MGTGVSYLIWTYQLKPFYLLLHLTRKKERKNQSIKEEKKWNERKKERNEKIIKEEKENYLNKQLKKFGGKKYIHMKRCCFYCIWKKKYLFKYVFENLSINFVKIYCQFFIFSKFYCNTLHLNSLQLYHINFAFIS